MCSTTLERWQKQWDATEAVDESSTTALQWLRTQRRDLPEPLLRRLFRERSVRLYKPVTQQVVRTTAHARLSRGMQLLLPRGVAPAGGPRHTPPPGWAALFEELMARRLYHDEQLLVLNKPPGLPVQGGTGVRLSLDSVLQAGFAQRGWEPPRLVHRLDRDTSGALVLAATAHAAAWLSAAFRSKGCGTTGPAVERTYWAVLLSRRVLDSTGTIDMPVVSRATAAAAGPAAHKREAATHSALTKFRLIEQRRGMAWCELRPVTGRKHQLRIHCADALHSPIVGDPQYGNPPNMPPAAVALELAGRTIGGWHHPQLCLHARSVHVHKPDGSRVDAVAELPAHMQQLFACLQWKH